MSELNGHHFGSPKKGENRRSNLMEREEYKKRDPRKKELSPAHLHYHIKGNRPVSSLTRREGRGLFVKLKTGDAKIGFDQKESLREHLTNMSS